MLLTDLRDAWLLSRRIAKPSVHTMKAYQSDYTQIAIRLAAHEQVEPEYLTVAALTSTGLRAAFADLADTHSPASVARSMSTWRMLCRFAVAEKHLPTDPTVALPPVHVGKRLPSAFSDSSTSRILRVVQAGQVPGRNPWPERDYAVIATLLVAGLRASELTRLNLGDVLTGDNGVYLHIRGKGNKERNVPVREELVMVLDAYLDTVPGRFPAVDAPQPSDPLFLANNGKRFTQGSLEYLVEKVYRAAGVAGERPAGAMVHATRHTFGTRLVENGASAVEVMKLLGHATLQSSQLYLDASPTHLQAAAGANPAYRVLRETNG